MLHFKGSFKSFTSNLLFIGCDIQYQSMKQETFLPVSAPPNPKPIHQPLSSPKYVFELAESFVQVFLCTVQFSCSVVSNSLQPHGLQHARLPCLSPTPRVYPNSCPLSRWCHPTISSSALPFSTHLQSFPASESFQISQFFPSGGQSIGASASTSVLSMNIQGWSPLGLTGWILQSKGLSRVFSNTTVQKH